MKSVGNQMSRPLHRGISGSRISGGSQDLFWDSQMKDKSDKEVLISMKDSSDHYSPRVKLASQLFHPSSSPSKYMNLENGYSNDAYSILSHRSWHKFILFPLRLSLILILALVAVGSLWWTISISISTSSRVLVKQNHARLYDNVVSDLWDIGDIFVGSVKSRELEFCPEEFENQVPCYNATDDAVDDISDVANISRKCGTSGKEHCLVIPPVNYKIPLRWPTGKDIIWVANVKITAQRVLSSGSLTKRYGHISRILLRPS